VTACSLVEVARLGFRRRRSAASYRDMQTYIARCSVEELRERGVNLARSRVLELAAGKGGYSQVLAESSSSFVASDIVKDPFFADEHPEIRWETVDVRTRFPFDDDSFDFIYCSSLIEHIAAPGEMLREARRVLADSGSMLLSFPPFWSLSMVGGHTFKPFHFLGERAAIRLTNFLRNSSVASYAEAYGEEGGLFPLRVRDVAKLVRDGEFRIEDQYTRMSRLNTARWPGLLGDLFTWHVCYLLKPVPLPT